MYPKTSFFHALEARQMETALNAVKQKHPPEEKDETTQRIRKNAAAFLKAGEPYMNDEHTVIILLEEFAPIVTLKPNDQGKANIWIPSSAVLNKEEKKKLLTFRKELTHEAMVCIIFGVLCSLATAPFALFSYLKWHDSHTMATIAMITWLLFFACYLLHASVTIKKLKAHTFLIKSTGSVIGSAADSELVFANIFPKKKMLARVFVESFKNAEFKNALHLLSTSARITGGRTILLVSERESGVTYDFQTSTLTVTGKPCAGAQFEDLVVFRTDEACFKDFLLTDEQVEQMERIFMRKDVKMFL